MKKALTLFVLLVACDESPRHPGVVPDPVDARALEQEFPVKHTFCIRLAPDHLQCSVTAKFIDEAVCEEFRKYEIEGNKPYYKEGDVVIRCAR